MIVSFWFVINRQALSTHTINSTCGIELTCSRNKAGVIQSSTINRKSNSPTADRHVLKQVCEEVRLQLVQTKFPVWLRCVWTFLQNQDGYIVGSHTINQSAPMPAHCPDFQKTFPISLLYHEL